MRAKGQNHLKNSISWKRRRARGIIDLLYGTDAFRSLTANDMHLFFEHVAAEQCPVGTLLFTPDDPGERLYILKEGRVELYRLTPDGKRLVTRQIKPVSLFGIMGLVGQSMQGNFAETVEDSLVCTVTRKDVLELLRKRPDVALCLLELLGTRLRLLEERLLDAAYGPVEVRLAHFLLANIDKSSQLVPDFTQTEIADSIGAVRQTVNKALGEMQRQGIVSIRLKRILVLEPHRLKEIAES